MSFSLLSLLFLTVAVYLVKARLGDGKTDSDGVGSCDSEALVVCARRARHVDVLGGLSTESLFCRARRR